MIAYLARADEITNLETYMEDEELSIGLREH